MSMGKSQHGHVCSLTQQSCFQCFSIPPEESPGTEQAV